MQLFGATVMQQMYGSCWLGGEGRRRKLFPVWIGGKNLTLWTAMIQTKDMNTRRRGGGGGGLECKKKVGVLVVSLRGVNFRFWSRLGC